jgi:hypothetical protein
MAPVLLLYPAGIKIAVYHAISSSSPMMPGDNSTALLKKLSELG